MKKLILLVMFLTLLPSHFYAKDEYPKLPVLSNKQMQDYIYFQSFQSKGGKYGYQLAKSKTNKKNKTIVKAVFDNAESFYSYELGKVKYQGKWGIVDRSMRYIFEPKYDDVTVYKISHYYKEYLIKCCCNNKYGLYNYQQEELLALKYDDISESEDKNIFTMRIGNLMGCINVSNHQMIPCEYVSVLPILKDDKKYHYLCQKNNKFGVLDNDAKTIIPFYYDEIKVLNQINNRLLYQAKENERYTLWYGNKKVECDSVVLVNNRLMLTDNHKVGMYSLELKQLIPMNYDGIKDKGDYFSVLKGGKFGAYTLKGLEIVDTIFDHELKLENGQYEEYYDETKLEASVITSNGVYGLNYLPYGIKVNIPDVSKLMLLDSSIELKKCKKESTDDDLTALEQTIKRILSPFVPSDVKADAIFKYAELTKGKDVCLEGDGADYYKQANDSVFLKTNFAWNEPMSTLYSLWKQNESEDEYYETTDNKGNTYTHRVISKTSEFAKHESIMVYENSQKNDTYLAFMEGSRIISEIASQELMERFKNNVSDKYDSSIGMCGIHPLENNLYAIEASFKEYIGQQTIVYDDPTYISVGPSGHLMMVNSGRYTEKFYEYDHYLFVIDKNFNVIRTILRPKNHLLTFWGDNSFCFIPEEDSENVNDVIFYDNKGKYKFTYCPPDGHVFSNVVKYGDAMYIGGYTTTRGYIDFANPMVVKFDANTGKHIETKYLKQKAWVRQLAIKDNVLFALLDNKEHKSHDDVDVEVVYGSGKDSDVILDKYVPFLKLHDANADTFADTHISMQDFKWGGKSVTYISVNPASELYEAWKGYYIIIPTDMKNRRFEFSDDGSHRIFAINDGKEELDTIYAQLNHNAISTINNYRKAEQELYVPILKSLLLHPLGFPSIKWTDSRKRICNYLAEKYPQLESNDNSNWSVSEEYQDNTLFPLKDIPHYYAPIKSVSSGWDGWNYKIDYYLRGVTPVIFKKIREDLITLGFEMGEFDKDKDYSGCFKSVPGYPHIKNISIHLRSYGVMQISIEEKK